ncbi:hypothetical protein HPB51_017555 [Rhipicephalus microplus]|uniref:Uncharacterized protein n=1 Tax=Rhipicephalus microplus TaxID=6941 RepID=A0A9J6F5F7_RHIMP|nr:hypothetical protein HPB51_017555 [Rhipicephalus microplus]
MGTEISCLHSQLVQLRFLECPLPLKLLFVTVSPVCQLSVSLQQLYFELGRLLLLISQVLLGISEQLLPSALRRCGLVAKEIPRHCVLAQIRAVTVVLPHQPPSPVAQHLITAEQRISDQCCTTANKLCDHDPRAEALQPHFDSPLPQFPISCLAFEEFKVALELNSI